jgi:hypothetical protein
MKWFLGCRRGTGITVSWPLGIPDLTTLDFYFGECIKSVVYGAVGDAVLRH